MGKKNRKTNLMDLLIPILLMSGIVLGFILIFAGEEFLKYSSELVLSAISGVLVFYIVIIMFRSQGYKRANYNTWRRNGNFISKFVIQVIEYTLKFTGLISGFLFAYFRIFENTVNSFFLTTDGQFLINSSTPVGLILLTLSIGIGYYVYFYTLD